jgi:hypothetical protein
MSIDGDYTFPNSLYIHTAFLYVDFRVRDKYADYMDWVLHNWYEKGFITPSILSIFNEIRFQPMPLLGVGIMSILNPDDHSHLIGPSLTYSLVTNADLTLTGLLFEGDEDTEFGDSGDMVLLKLKYSF